MSIRHLRTTLLLALAPAALGAQTYYPAGTGVPPMAGYGGALAVGDGEVFVGEAANTYRSGFVHVFRRGADGWAEAARLTAPNAELGDGFGAALAVEGDRLLVTALRGASPPEGGGRGGFGRGGDGPPPGPFGSAVHVFERGADGSWTATGAFRTSDAQEGDGFGASVALSGDWAFVGAPGQGGNRGAVYVFRRSADGRFALASRLEPVNGQPGGRFGSSLAVADGRLLVGAPAGSAGFGGRRGRGFGGRGGGAAFESPPSGMVHVFTLNGNVWESAGRLAVPGSGSRFGATVAFDGERALVSAPGRGLVLTFAPGADGGWTEMGRVEAPATDAEAAFGSSLAVNGDEMWVGAPGGEDGGAAVVLRRQGRTFANGQRLSNDSGSRFGATVAARGDLAAVGVLGALDGDGAVVIYERAGDAWREARLLESEPDELPMVTGGEPLRCDSDGRIQVYECGNTQLLSFMPISALSADGHRGARMNDVWGWTDPETGREYALAGRTDGTAFVDITDPANPVLIGDLPLTEGARPNAWRDIKTYQDHAFIVADGAGPHGMQVFDLTRLRDVQDPPVVFDADALYTRINSSHDIVINEETGFAYAVGLSSGGETCGGGYHMIDIHEPENPTFAGCFAHEGTGRQGTGYTHDAQCVVYHGPDERYRGREICVGANENALSIADLTDKADPVPLSTAEYPYYGYTHQGWFTEDHRYFFQDDESDETGPGGDVPFTRTMIWDMSDLEDPVLAKEYWGTERTFDHNLYIKGDTVYQSNYKSGLRVLDISDPLDPREVGFFDNYPIGENDTGFSGSWSNYPYFGSGTIVVTGIGEGLYLVKVGSSAVF